jgi:serine protease
VSAVAALVLVAMAAGTATPAGGLIVKLKAAPGHDRLAEPHERALAVREQQRWQRVLAESALAGPSGRTPPALGPVGRDQHRLDFGRRLGGDEARRIAERLARHADVAWAEPDVRERRAQANDPSFPLQWWLREAGGTNANAIGDRLRGVPSFVRAWQSGIAGSTGTPAGVVAVLDSGLTAHPELAGRTLGGYDFVAEAAYANDGNGRDADPADPGDWVASEDLANPAFAGCEVEDSSWHGTINAGIVGAATDNGVGVAGINRVARVLPVRVAGKCGAALSDIVDGMRWAAGLPVSGAPPNPNPARIVNISFGGNPVCGPTYQEAIDELRALGVVVVAAAGNDFGAPTRPASCTGVVGVVALNRDGFKTNYSNFGTILGATGIATVGGDDNDGRWGPLLADSGIYTVWNSGRTVPGQASYAGLFGTSFAAPIVSGALGLMLSVNPALTWDQLVAGLRLSARPHVTSPRIGVCAENNPGRCLCTTATCGVGILDAEQALRYAAAPQAYVPPARQPEVIDNPEVTQAAALGPDRGAAPPPADPPPPAGGGGAFSSLWLLALLAATAALARWR